MYCLLVLLFLSGQIFAQPVEGPWILDETSPDIGLRDVHVLRQPQEVVDVFYIAYRPADSTESVQHLLFSLEDGSLISGPDTLLAYGTWTWSIEDAMPEGGQWYLTLTGHHYRSMWAAEDSNRTFLFSGGGSLPSQTVLHNGVFHYMSNDGDSWLKQLHIGPCVGGGYTVNSILFGTAPYYGEEDNAGQFYLFDSGSVTPLAIYSGYSGGNLYGPMLIGAISISPDSFQAVYDGVYPGLTAGVVPGETTAPLDCDPGSVISYRTMRTPGGTMLATMFAQHWPLPPATQLVNVNAVNGTCFILNELDDGQSVQCDAYQPAYGIVSLATFSTHLRLSRADTNGIFTSPRGVFYWRDTQHPLKEGNLDLAPDGQVVVVWTEATETDTLAHRLLLGAVFWDTPLAAHPPDLDILPSSFSLSAYPNPFNSTLEIRYALPRAEKVEVAVFNVLGQKVAVLENGIRNAGTHNVTWTANGGSGIYFVTLQTDSEVRTEKVLLAR